jgi:hypothetical protein
MKLYIPAAIVALGLSGAALGQELPEFEEVDANADGLISQEEAAVVESIDFVTADTNQDGSLDRAEYEALSE